jgi:hypothetical protein
MNQDLKGRRFANVADVHRESLVALDSIYFEISDNASSRRSSAGFAASSHRGSTLKETNFKTCTTILNAFLTIA